MPRLAAVFDLDGTLLNSLDDLADSMNLSLAALGFQTHPVPAYRYFVGDGVENLARRALPQDRTDESTVSAAVKGMRENYGTRWKAKSRPYDGVPELLDTLQARGVKLAVLTNKPDDFTREIMREFFGRWRWDSVLGSRPHVPKKPDPAGALETAQALGVRPDEVLYIGDTNTDMFTARAANFFALGATWGFRPAEELTAAGAHALAAQPLDVLKHL